MKKYIWILALTLILLSVLLWTWCYDVCVTDLFWVQVCVNRHSEQVECWENGQGEYYVFLPGYAELADVKICMKTETPIYLDGKMLTDGMSCEGISLDTTYELQYSYLGKRLSKKITFLRSEGTAAMYIDTESGSMDYIHDDKTNEETGVLRLYTSEGTLDHAGQLESIHGRGNVTWTEQEKKPYSLRLSQEADLLGMGSGQKWILLANAYDASNLRNKIVFDFAKQVGLAFSPESEWVELYLNGEYAGLYLLCERNEVHPQRVDISEDNSFLVSVELESRLVAQNYPYIVTQEKQALRLHYPEDLTQQELTELSGKWQTIENALLAKDGIDPVTGKSWTELIDLNSWARKYLIEEIFCSIDGGILSQFFYCDGSDLSGKVYAGPVWDFDKSMGIRTDWEIVNPNILYANQLHDRAGLSTPWFYSLYQKEAFYDAVVSLYQDVFMPQLEQLLTCDLVAYADRVSVASRLNQIRWSESTDDFDEEVAYIRDYMQARMRFLESVWCDEVEYCFVNVDYGYDCSYAVIPGEKLDGLYAFEDLSYADFIGWYDATTNAPFDVDQPITEDMYIYPKWEDSTSKQINQVLQLMPLAIIALLGGSLLWVEIKRMRKDR